MLALVAMTLVVMAAGLGSRFGGSKQTAGVGPHGEWLLDYSVFDARRAGFERVVLVVGEGGTDAFASVRDRWPRDLQVLFVEQRLDDVPSGPEVSGRRKPWGTAHAVLAARRELTAPFAVVNADDFYGADAYRLAGEGCRRAARDRSATVVGMRLDRTLSPHGAVTRGVCRVEASHRLMQVEEVAGLERRDRTVVDRDGRRFEPGTIVSMNLWTFAESFVADLQEGLRRFLNGRPAPADECRLPDLVSELVVHERLAVRVVEAPGPWFGLTHPADREPVEAGLRDLVARGVYPSPLWPRAVT
jgi:NDP-sugar pyrophosphorylase family protein